MPRFSEAYDFSLFEERKENTAAVELPLKEEESSKKNNVIELPEKELRKNRKPKRHPLKAVATLVGLAIFFTAMAGVVYNQMELTVLTDKINSVNAQLEEAKSVEIQLSMQASQKMNGAQVEEYAEKELGMSKISEGQVTYVNVAQDDKGTVVKEEQQSLVDQVLSVIRSWFA